MRNGELIKYNQMNVPTIFFIIATVIDIGWWNGF